MNYIKASCIIFCAKLLVLIFPIYIRCIRFVNYVLNCFKYFLIYFGQNISYFGTNVPKKIRQEKNVELYKITRYSQRFLNYIKTLSDKMFQYSQIVYTQKALPSKNRFYFFSSSDKQKFNHLVGCYTLSINPSFHSFLSALLFSDLIYQAKCQIWIIVPESSST